jgi:hypothetical protein
MDETLTLLGAGRDPPSHSARWGCDRDPQAHVEVTVTVRAPAARLERVYRTMV